MMENITTKSIKSITLTQEILENSLESYLDKLKSKEVQTIFINREESTKPSVAIISTQEYECLQEQMQIYKQLMKTEHTKEIE